MSRPGYHPTALLLSDLAVPLLVAAVCVLPRPAAGAEFIRGDANADGSVTLADAHAILRRLFGEREFSQCLSADDVDADGNIDLTDAVKILNHVALDGPPPVAPFPEPGEPVEPSRLGCDEYGGGSELEDPAAVVEVLSAGLVSGGDGHAVIRLGVASAGRVAGYTFILGIDASLVETVVESPLDLTASATRGLP